MRRLLSDLANYLGRLVTATRRGWNAFFFTPADPTALGLIRVVVGLLALWSLVVLGLDVGEDAGAVEKFAREQSYSFPLLIGAEPDVAARYFVEAYPSTFVIDRLGHIVFRDLGGGDPAKLQAAVEKALGGH